MAQRLEEAERLRSNLVADVAHELRTPLTVLQGNLRAILDDVYPLSKAEVASLYDQTRLLSRLVNDLHEISQAEANKLPLNKASIDISELLHSIGTTFGPMAEAEGVSLTVRTQMNLLMRGDYTRLSQVMHNLLTNALYHTPRDGNITVYALRDGEIISISVTDDGAGISAEHLSHIFDRFYRADRARSRNRGGAGLGLAVTKAIITAHGGAITATSKGLGLGTSFIIELPAHQQQSNYQSNGQSDTSIHKQLPMTTG
jgi:signal transduction histidine kinase